MIMVKMKKQKPKKPAIKRKLKFEDYIDCLEANQLEKQISHLEKNKINIDSLRKNHENFIKNKRLILKSLRRFRREKYNVFT